MLLVTNSQNLTLSFVRIVIIVRFLFFFVKEVLDLVDLFLIKPFR